MGRVVEFHEWSAFIQVRSLTPMVDTRYSCVILFFAQGVLNVFVGLLKPLGSIYIDRAQALIGSVATLGFSQTPPHLLPLVYFGKKSTNSLWCARCCRLAILLPSVGEQIAVAY